MAHEKRQTIPHRARAGIEPGKVFTERRTYTDFLQAEIATEWFPS